jgi:ElaB/YqjD/DUF883 family membrane-anchored ribosome-binding protein
MVSPVQEVRKNAHSASDEWTLDQLRESVAGIASDLKKVVEARAHAAQENAQEGVRVLRKNIRKQPAAAMAIAAGAGAVLAVLLVPRFGRRPVPSRWQTWMPTMPSSMPSVTRADLYDFADRMQRSAVRTANSIPLTATLERLVDAVSKVEPNASLTAAVEKAGTWFQKLRSAAKT